MNTPQQIQAFQARLQQEIARSMDELVDKLADELKREFGHILHPNSGDESWRVAAAGIVTQMNIRVDGWIDANHIPYLMANFPIARERYPLFSVGGPS